MIPSANIHLIAGLYVVYFVICLLLAVPIYWDAKRRDNGALFWGGVVFFGALVSYFILGVLVMIIYLIGRLGNGDL